MMGAKIELQVTYVTHIMKCAKKKNLTQVKGLLGTYQRLFTMYVPKISAPAVSLGKKMGMNSFGNKSFMHAANGKAQHALMNHPIFSLFERGENRYFLVFPIFPMCSHHVLK
jgi:hypothetical protein